MQSFSASRYTGHRVRFAAVIRTHEAGGWAGLWLRGKILLVTLDELYGQPS